jgi:hypothetical protein
VANVEALNLTLTTYLRARYGRETIPRERDIGPPFTSCRCWRGRGRAYRVPLLPLLTVRVLEPSSEKPPPPLSEVPDSATVPDVVSAAPVLTRMPLNSLLVPWTESTPDPVVDNDSVLPSTHTALLVSELPLNVSCPSW